MPKDIQNSLLYGKLVLVAIFFGSTFIAGKILAQYVPPFTASFLRFFIAASFLMIYISLVYPKRPHLNNRVKFLILTLALTGIVGYNFFFFSGLKRIDASRASMIVALNPASIMLFSCIFYQEKLNLRKISGIILSFSGALIVITHGHPQSLFQGSIGLGELYILGCVICWTSFTLISKLVIKSMPALITIALACGTGALILFFPAWQEGFIQHFQDFNLTIWLSAFALGLLGTVIAYLWYYQGIKKIGPSRTGIFINFVPVSATAMAILFLDEKLSTSFVMGAILVIMGVCLMNKK